MFLAGVVGPEQAVPPQACGVQCAGGPVLRQRPAACRDRCWGDPFCCDQFLSSLQQQVRPGVQLQIADK